MQIEFGGNKVVFYPYREILPFLVTDAVPLGDYRFVLGLNKAVTSGGPIDGLFSGLDVFTPSRGCTTGTNAFYLHEIEVDADRYLKKFAADFSYNCGGGDHQVQGVVRFHSSVPSVLQRAFAVAGPDFDVGEGRRILLDGSRSWSPASKLSKATWTQQSGPPLDLSQCKTFTCPTYSPAMPNGGGTAVLRLEVETENGLKDSDLVRVNILSNSDRKTLFEMWGQGFVASSGNAFGSDASIGVSSGKAYVSTRNSTGSIYLNQTSERLSIGFSGLTPDSSLFGASVELMNKRGNPLVAGTFFDVGSGGGFEPFDNTASVVISNGSGGLACGHQQGRMIIGEIDRDPLDFTKIRSLSAFLRTNCVVMGATELASNYARILINHLPLNRPTAKITGNSSVNPGGLITLSSNQSFGVRSIDTTVWRQIFGPTGDESSISADGRTFTLRVNGATPSGTRLVFSVNVIDDAGEQDTALFSVTVN